jgi:hypothetical protein
MGLPMIVPSMILMVPALIPIMFLESLIVGRCLGLRLRDTIPSVGVGNLATTLVGIPITWFCLLLIEFGVVYFAAEFDRSVWNSVFSMTIGAPWIAPGHGDESRVIFGAMLFLLVPYFLASWLIEYWVGRKMLDPLKGGAGSNSRVFRAFGLANFASYSLLALVWVLLSQFLLSS